MRRRIVDYLVAAAVLLSFIAGQFVTGQVPTSKLTPADGGTLVAIEQIDNPPPPPETGR